MPKILAPIRTFEEVVKVIDAGANEVYCGVKIPGLGRFQVKRTGNKIFEMSNYKELRKIVDYAHAHNVKVIVTVNQPFIVEAMEEIIKKHFRACIAENVDAFIIGDIGILSILKEMNSNVPFYASTYLATMNSEAVEFLRKLGFTRIVLDRQVKFEEIAQIVQQSKADLEVFIHGGGCSNIDVSCYLFHYILARKVSTLARHLKNVLGNPCNIPYDIYSLENNDKIAENVPIMDASEYCSFCKLPELIKLGIAGFKIEGRGRSIWDKENIAKAYRTLLDLLEQNDFGAFQQKIDDLKKHFNPEPPSIISLEDRYCSQKRCYYPPPFHAQYKLPLSWTAWTKAQYNLMVIQK